MTCSLSLFHWLWLYWQVLYSICSEIPRAI
jgi:hypothetical protein